MKERPILFSGPMVLQVLAGTKTHTRRVAPISELNIKPYSDGLVTWGVNFTKPVKGVLGSHSGGKFSELQARSIIASQFNPYGRPGDRLWVRETWQYAGFTEDGYPFVRYQADGARRLHDRSPSDEWSERWTDIWAGLSGPSNFDIDGTASDRRWRPSIHMPRWASRIVLEVTGVRVERLQDISAADAMAEGVFFTDYGRKCGHTGNGWTDVGDCPAPTEHHPQRPGWAWKQTTSHEQCLCSPTNAFGNLWEHINGPGSWDANPWVWVIEFKRTTP